MRRYGAGTAIALAARRGTARRLLRRGRADPGAATGRPTGTLPPRRRRRRTPAEKLGLATGWGPTAAELDLAARIVRRMRLPDLAGQVIVADWSGTAAPVTLVRRCTWAGSSPSPTTSPRPPRSARSTHARARRRLAAGRCSWRSTRRAASSSASRETRRASRVHECRAQPTTWPHPEAQRPPAAPSCGAWASRSTSLRMPTSPSGPADPTIGSRSVGSDPDLVAQHVVAAASGISESGVVPVLKHFPGTARFLPTATHAAGADAYARPARRDRPAPFGRPWTRESRRSWPAISTSAPSIRGRRRRCLAAWSPACCVTTSASTGWSSPTRSQMAGVRPGRDGGPAGGPRLRAGNDVLPDADGPGRRPARHHRRPCAAAHSAGRASSSAAARQIALLLASRAGHEARTSRPSAGIRRPGLPRPVRGRHHGRSRTLPGTAGRVDRLALAVTTTPWPRSRPPPRPPGSGPAAPDPATAARPRGAAADYRRALRNRWRARERRRTDRLATWQRPGGGAAGPGHAGRVRRLRRRPRLRRRGRGCRHAVRAGELRRRRSRIATYGDTPGAMACPGRGAAGYERQRPGGCPSRCAGCPDAGAERLRTARPAGDARARRPG